MRIVIAGGGTAGHVFPALALADRLRSVGVEVSFIGTRAGQEARLVPEAGYAFHAVAAEQLPRKASPAAVRASFKALGSIGACVPVVRAADVVVGMGGYVSVPAVLAARLAGRPVVLHEQNAIPGLANRLGARWARSVALSFADAAARLPRARTVVTGNPVRASILEVPARRDALEKEAWSELDLDPERTTVVVFGGSQGALHVDRTLAGAVPWLRDRADLQLLVLTGPAHVDVVATSAREPMALRIRVLPFLERMELALATADLAVARAGATSIAELMICGVPSVLVPYPHATENHQEANAREVERAGAAVVVLNDALTPGVMRDRILELVEGADRRQAMARAASAWAKPDAAERLAAVVMEAAA